MTHQSRTALFVSMVAVATSMSGCFAGSGPDLQRGVTIDHGLSEAGGCVNLDRTVEVVTSPGSLIVDRDGTFEVPIPVERISGAADVLVGVGIARNDVIEEGGVSPGDVFPKLRKSMGIEYSPVTVEGPGTWPIVIVIRPSDQAVFSMPSSTSDVPFELHVNNCDEEGSPEVARTSDPAE